MQTWYLAEFYPSKRLDNLLFSNRSSDINFLALSQRKLCSRCTYISSETVFMALNNLERVCFLISYKSYIGIDDSLQTKKILNSKFCVLNDNGITVCCQYKARTFTPSIAFKKSNKKFLKTHSAYQCLKANAQNIDIL